jgi:NADPH:quinone reductase-like Zn-dependent oxidoreductase
MRAAVFATNGGPEVIRIEQLPTPTISETEVLVRVEACGLNHLDLWVREGLPGRIPMPHIGGCETVGIVAAVGERVRGLTIGERVMISPTQGCGHCDACFRGDEPVCPNFVVPGEDTQGGFAEFAVAEHRHIIPLSDAWTSVEWAATPLVFLTAYRMLHRQAGIGCTSCVLVESAASGVGSAAIQLAVQAGARVFSTASTPEKKQLGLDLGSELVIDPACESISDRVKEATNGRGVDAVIHHVGSATWKECLRSLARGGSIVCCGATTGPRVEIDLRFFFIREINVLGSCMGSRSELNTVISMLNRRLVRPVVDRTFPLEQLAEAQQYLSDRRQLGKIVITA